MKTRVLFQQSPKKKKRKKKSHSAHASHSRLEIILSKHEEGLMWSYLVEHDDCGEQLPDSELAQQIHEKLEHLCSENEVLLGFLSCL